MSAKPSGRERGGNRQQVLEVLQAGGRPPSAYELLDRLREAGIKAPPTVYRALNQLIDAGQVHRLESVNAYGACRHRHHHGIAAFAICDDCGTVTEFEDADTVAGVQGWAARMGFAVTRSAVELHGCCADCAAWTCDHPDA